VGVAIPVALGPRLAAGEPRGRLARRIAARAAVIFALGLVLHAVPRFDWATLRVPGVLQRIAVCYLAAALLFLATGWRAQATVAATALLGYWGALALVPVPGYGAGDLRPEANLAAWLDRAVLGPHIWRASRVYDPEGILSTVPAIATTLAGVLAGLWLASGRPRPAVVRGLAAAGAAAAAAGLAWDRWLPINKALWTSSYALFTAGAALLALAACYWLIEVRGLRWGTAPIAALGGSALAVFFLSTLVARLLADVRVAAAGGARRPLQAVLFEALFAPWASPVNASLLWALATLLLWTAVFWPLARRNIRLRV
jgi:predicted acyltransferase